MKLYVGLDVSQDATYVCVVNAEGKILWQGQCLSNPDSIAAMVREKP